MNSTEHTDVLAPQGLHSKSKDRWDSGNTGGATERSGTKGLTNMRGEGTPVILQADSIWSAGGCTTISMKGVTFHSWPICWTCFGWWSWASTTQRHVLTWQHLIVGLCEDRRYVEESAFMTSDQLSDVPAIRFRRVSLYWAV